MDPRTANHTTRSGPSRAAIAALFVAIAAGCAATPGVAPAPAPASAEASAAPASVAALESTTSSTPVSTPTSAATPTIVTPEATSAPTTTTTTTTTATTTTTTSTTTTPPSPSTTTIPELDESIRTVPETGATDIVLPPTDDGVPVAVPAVDAPLVEAPAVDGPLVEASTIAQARDRVELAEGHTDLIEVTLDAGKLRIQVKDDTKPGGAVFRDPTDVQIRVRDAAKTASPAGAQFSFLGPAGTPLYLLPQVQASGLLWPGWSTERLGVGQVVGDEVTLTMSSLTGPGTLVMFTTNQFGAPNVLFHSAVPGKNRMDVATRVHAHASWAFDRPGEYRMGITATATLANGTPLSTTVEYVILVGDSTPLAPWGSTTTVPSEGTTTVPGGTAGPSGGISGPSPSAPSTGAPASAPAPAAPGSGSGRSNPSSGPSGTAGGDTSVLGSNQAADSTQNLARTGSDVGLSVIVALWGIVAGGLLLLARRFGRLWSAQVSETGT